MTIWHYTKEFFNDLIHTDKETIKGVIGELIGYITIALIELAIIILITKLL
jgi:hypothetical protein